MIDATIVSPGWVIVIVGCIAAYFIRKSVLLERELDEDSSRERALVRLFNSIIESMGSLMEPVGSQAQSEAWRRMSAVLDEIEPLVYEIEQEHLQSRSVTPPR